LSAFGAGHVFDIVRGRFIELLEFDVLAERDVRYFHRIKADKFQIRSQFLQFGQFQAQKLVIPASILSNFVVRDEVAALLFRRQVAELDAGNSRQPEAAGGSQPAVAGDDPAIPAAGIRSGAQGRPRFDPRQPPACSFSEPLLSPTPPVQF
jgi:hypothetical protein